MTVLPVSVNPGEQWRRHGFLFEFKEQALSGPGPLSNVTVWLPTVPEGYAWQVHRLVVRNTLGNIQGFRVFADPDNVGTVAPDGVVQPVGDSRDIVDGRPDADAADIMVFDYSSPLLVRELHRLGATFASSGVAGPTNGAASIRADGFKLRRFHQ